MAPPLCEYRLVRSLFLRHHPRITTANGAVSPAVAIATKSPPSESARPLKRLPPASPERLPERRSHAQLAIAGWSSTHRHAPSLCFRATSAVALPARQHGGSEGDLPGNQGRTLISKLKLPSGRKQLNIKLANRRGTDSSSAASTVEDRLRVIPPPILRYRLNLPARQITGQFLADRWRYLARAG